MPKRTYSEAFTFAPTFAPSSQPAGSTQRALQASLTGNVVFDNKAIVDAVFQPSKVDDETVMHILAEITKNPSLKAARGKVLSGKLAETKKYEPMLTLFDHITTYEPQEATLTDNDYAGHVRRAWVDTHGQAVRTDPDIYLPGELGAEESSEDLSDEYERTEATAGKKRKPATRSGRAYSAKVAKNTAGGTPSTAALTIIDDRRPDLTLIDCPVGEDMLPHPYGRHACLFIEVKVDSDKQPNPQHADTKRPSKTTKATNPPKGPPQPRVKAILRQIADVARLHLATRPFMRYSLHITLCGTIFNVCLFDRAGGVVSKNYDLKQKGDLETFVRIIRRATCNMNAYELGLDPTVIPLDYLGSVARYPRFKVEVGENTYYTHGFPIWQSTTLQGRGTWVFGATKDNNPNPGPKERLVLKNAWRASGRLPESTLYGIINKLQTRDDMLTLRCVAGFVDGGDVMIEEEIQQGGSAGSSKGKERVVTRRVATRVSGHRQFVEDAESSPHNPTLHRVVLATRGRSMVTYTSLVELLSAAACAAEGLLALYQRGVDHRDVSIGNVFLGTDPEKAAGFISDLDLSSISEEAIKAAYPNNYDQIISQMNNGEWQTGTALFMADGLLTALLNQRLPGRNLEFQHTLSHDFESLIWVVIYAMMIRRRKVLLEARFFRDAMRLVRGQAHDDEFITYERLCELFRKHLLLAKETQVPT